MSVSLFCGVLLHLLVALQTINSNTPKADFKMVWRQYWQTDYLLFAISILGCILYMLLINEWLDLNKLDHPDTNEPKVDQILHGHVAGFVKTISVIVGAFADYLVFKFWSKTKKAIDKKFEEDKT